MNKESNTPKKLLNTTSIQPLPNNSNFMHALPPQILPLMPPKPMFNGFIPPQLANQHYPISPAMFSQQIFPVSTSAFPITNTTVNAMKPAPLFNSKQSASTVMVSKLSNSSLNSQQNLQTTTRNQSNNHLREVDVLVVKTDGKPVNNKEFKRGIFDLLNNEYKVSSFSILQNDKTNIHASIRLPKLIDALWCVHNLNRACSETNTFNFSLMEGDTSDPLLKLKAEVFSLLYNESEKWMSINDFLAAFKAVYKRAFHLLDLDKVKELVYIDGKPQFQFVCLLQNPIGHMKIKFGPTFKRDTVEILKTHNRRVPLAR